VYKSKNFRGQTFLFVSAENRTFELAGWEFTHWGGIRGRTRGSIAKGRGSGGRGGAGGG